MGQRLKLHEELVALAKGSCTVYFQPPTGMRLSYPCIVYSKDSGDADYADNGTYRYTQRYEVTVITTDPDCELPEEVLGHFKMCRMDRQFVTENLYHNVLVLYY